MLTAIECPCCGNRDLAFLEPEGTHWRCLACGNGWESEAMAAAPSPAVDTLSRLASEIRSLEQVIALLRTPDNGFSRLAGVLSTGDLQIYLETRLGLDDALRGSISESLDRLRTRPHLALFTLRYLLTDDSLDLTPRVEVRTLDDLVRVLAPAALGRESTLAGLRALSADGRLVEWLRIRAPVGGAGAVAAMDAVLGAYPGEPDLVVYTLLWRLAPDMGFPVEDGWVKTAKELAAWLDYDDDHRARGLDLLDRGWIDTWLVASGRLDAPGHLSARIPTSLTRAARAETLLWLLDPDLPGPRVLAEPARLKLSYRSSGPESTIGVTLCSEGPGYAWGSVDLQGTAPGVELLTRHFDGTPSTVSLRIRPSAMRPGASHDLTLVIRTCGPRADHELRVPMCLQVRGSTTVTTRTTTSSHWALNVFRFLLGGASGAIIGATFGALVGGILSVLVLFLLGFPAFLLQSFIHNVTELLVEYVGKSVGTIGITAGAIAGLILGATLAARSLLSAVLLIAMAIPLIHFGLENKAAVMSTVQGISWFLEVK